MLSTGTQKAQSAKSEKKDVSSVVKRVIKADQIGFIAHCMAGKGSFKKQVYHEVKKV